ncbi:MAG: hypothetical protein R2845_11310 [Thermomicrobiales bacterium]
MVPDHDGVSVSIDDADRILDGFAFDGRRETTRAFSVLITPPPSRCMADSGLTSSGARFVKKCGEDSAIEPFFAARQRTHEIGMSEDGFEVGAAELIDGDNMLQRHGGSFALRRSGGIAGQV